MVTVCSWNKEQNFALGLDVLVTRTSWNTNGVIMLRACMLWSPTLAVAVFHEGRKLQKPPKHCNECDFRTFYRNADMLPEPALRALPSLRKCVEYCEGQ